MKNFFSVLSVLIIDFSFTSGQTYFDKGFELSSPYYPRQVLQLPDNSFLLYGGAILPMMGFLAKSDVSGNIMWARRSECFGVGVGAIFSSANLVTGNSLIFSVEADYPNKGSMVKTDLDLNIAFGYSVDYALDVGYETSDGNYLFAGRNNPSTEGVYLHKISQAGSLIFGYKYKTGLFIYDLTDKIVYDLLEHSNGDYLMLMNLGNDIFVSRLNSSGIPVWTKSYLTGTWSSGSVYSLYGGKLLPLMDGSTLVVGGYGSNGALLSFAIDANGNVLWSKSYTATTSIGPVNAFLNPDNSITIYGIRYSAPQLQHVFLEIDQSGNLMNGFYTGQSSHTTDAIWAGPDNNANYILLSFADTASSLGNGVTEWSVVHPALGNACNSLFSLPFTVDTNVLASTQSYSFNYSAAPTPQIVGLPYSSQNFIDYEFCLGIGVVEPQGDNVLIEIFPNPASSQLFIHSNARRISVTNILGEEVFSVSDPVKEQVIEVGHLPEGTYVVSVQTESKTVNKLIEVIH